MDHKQVVKQIITFNKTAFDNTFSAIVTLQEQTERMAGTLMESATWLPDDGKKVINDWVESFKKGRDKFKGGVDDSFKKVEDYFNK